MEYFDICDKDGLPTGEIIERKAAHRDGIRHRTAHVWVVRTENGRVQVLLQKRSLEKDSFPGRLDTSSAGHIQAGDEPLASAIRELGEELGITAAPEDLEPAGYFDIHYEKVFHGALFKDNEYSYVYIYRKPVDIDKLTLQKEEIESVIWVDYDETMAACLRHDPAFCVPIGGLCVLGKALGLPVPEDIDKNAK